MVSVFHITLMKMQLDSRVNVLHISVYAALIHLWYKGDMKNPVSISRRRVMELAKINAYATYHKCINELQFLGYIQYFPSYHPATGSFVYFPCFETERDA